ncbi:MAG: hypothetical protein WCF65_00775 [Parachlamydiaceae bacterium]
MSARTQKEKNHLSVAVRVFICIAAAGLMLFAYIEKQNGLTELRLAIPALAKELKDIEQENIRLTYEVEKFESPEHLMQLRQRPEYNHLKNSFFDDEIILKP